MDIIIRASELKDAKEIHEIRIMDGAVRKASYADLYYMGRYKHLGEDY